MTLGAGLAVLPLAGATAGQAAPLPLHIPATFTHNVRADAAEKGGGQNEPQVVVDQTGTAYVGWQSSTNPDGGSGVSRTTDGTHFTYLGNPDPGKSDTGDTALATTSWTSPTEKLTASLPGSAVFFSELGPAQAQSCPEGQINIRGTYTTDQGHSWTGTDATCQPLQVDRNWVAAYTEPQYRGTPQARQHTWVYQEYHDFGLSMIWVSTSSDGGTTWDTIGQHPAEQVGAAIVSNACNTTPGGIAVDQRGAHAGRVYVAWTTSDAARNLQGCNYTEAEPFDHVFVSYSDDHGTTWTTHTAWNDPCSPAPPLPPTNPTSCSDDQEIFTPIAIDDAGNVYVAFVDRPDSRTAAAGAPEFDIGVAYSTDGGNSWSGGAPDSPGTPRIANTDTGTHYFPWIAAGDAGAVDVIWYGTPFVEGQGVQQLPSPAPASAEWNVYMSQSLDVLHGAPFTQSRVSDHPNAFGDICTVGIFCTPAAPALLGTGGDRTLLDDMGVAIGPDGGARIAWTDTRDSWNGTCKPGNSGVGCQGAKEHVYFACQKSGVGLHLEAVIGCGQSVQLPATPPVAVPVAPVVPSLQPSPSAPAQSALPNTARTVGTAGGASAAALLLAAGVRRRRGPRPKLKAGC